MQKRTTTNEFSNITVSGTILVKGKVFAQDTETVGLTVLDLATLPDVVITGNQEVDGTSLFSGTVSFDAPVTFHAGVVVSVNKTILSPLPLELKGEIIVLQQLNYVDITFSLCNKSLESIGQHTEIFKVPTGCNRSVPVQFDDFELQGDTVRYIGTMWSPDHSKTVHLCYLSHC